jgi:hypothetical protein
MIIRKEGRKEGRKEEMNEEIFLPCAAVICLIDIFS